MTLASGRRRPHFGRLTGRSSSFRLTSTGRAERQFLCRLLRVKPVPRLQVSEMIGRRAACFRPVRLASRFTFRLQGLRPHLGRLGQARVQLPPLGRWLPHGHDRELRAHVLPGFPLYGSGLRAHLAIVRIATEPWLGGLALLA